MILDLSGKTQTILCHTCASST